MKKYLTLLLIVLLLAASTATAATWTQPEPESPYDIAVIPIRVTGSILGAKNYTVYRGGAAKDDLLNFCIRVSIPTDYTDAIATVSSKTATLNCANTSTLPKASGIWYMTEKGEWSRDIIVLTGYALTDHPSITACVKGSAKADGLTAGSYTIKPDSGGYVFSDNGAGVVFYPDASGKVYSAKVFDLHYGYSHTVTAAMFNEDTSWGATLRAVFRACGMSADDFIDRRIYMNDRILQSNFGRLVDDCYTASYGKTELPVVPVVEVPATGLVGDAFVAMGVAFMVLIAWLIYDMVRRSNHDKD